MFKKKIKYQIKILAYILSMQNNKIFAARDVAIDLKIPREYTAKLMQELRVIGLLKSRKGKGGGFSMPDEIKKINLNNLLTLLGHHDNGNCILGLDEIDSANQCPFCEIWKDFNSKFKQIGNVTNYNKLLKNFNQK